MKNMNKVFYVKTENGSPRVIFGHPWSTHEGIYRSEMCWYSGNKDLTVIEADTGIAKRFISEHDSNGNLLNISCVSCDIINNIL